MRLESAPDLIAEVLSSGNKEFDLTRTRDDYARFGVREYWTVDPLEGRVRVHALNAARLEEHPSNPDRVESRSLPGLALQLAPLRELAQRK